MNYIKLFQEPDQPLIKQDIQRLSFNNQAAITRLENQYNVNDIEQKRIAEARAKNPTSETVRYEWVDDNGNKIIKTASGHSGALKGISLIKEFTPLGDIELIGQSINSAGSGNYATAGLLAGMALLPNWLEKPLKQIGKGFKWFKPNNVQKLNNTERLQLLLQNKITTPSAKFTTDKIELLKQHLLQNDVDVSKFTNDDLQLMLNIRKQSLQNTAPKQYVISEPNEFGFRNYFYDQSWSKKEPAGKIDIIDLSGTKDLHIGGIQNLTQNSGSNKVLKGVSEPLYNSAIIVDKQTKNKGIITGEDLRSPKATEKILDKYKDKQKVGQYGERYWDDGNITYGHDVYKFNQPTTQTPTKSLLFNPDIITDKGKMKPNWNDSDIFKTLIPLTFLYGTQNTNE